MSAPKLGDTVYYSDPVNQEFSGITRPQIVIDSSFKYINSNFFYRIIKFIVYRFFVTPFAFLYCKLKFRTKIIGKDKLKAAKKSGYFLFGNHTQVPGDGFIPNIITFPRETNVIVNPDNIALKGTKTLMMMLGAVPTPTALSGFSGFNSAIEKVIAKKRCVVVYPEAHIWPYSTIIRPFPATSFRYPTKLNAPSFAFTVTYRKSKKGKPQIVTYIDGPFFGDGERQKDKQQSLRDKVHSAMTLRADSKDNYTFIKYLPQKEQL